MSSCTCPFYSGLVPDGSKLTMLCMSSQPLGRGATRGRSDRIADALDADAILAGQAALAGQPGDTVTVATTNLAHLSRFPGIDAQAWDQIQ